MSDSIKIIWLHDPTHPVFPVTIEHSLVSFYFLHNSTLAKYHVSLFSLIVNLFVLLLQEDDYGQSWAIPNFKDYLILGLMSFWRNCLGSLMTKSIGKNNILI